MMTMQTNKDLAQELFARFSGNDIDGVEALLHPDIRWIVPGRKELNPAAGPYDKDQIARLFRRMASQIDGGLAMRVVGAIAEADRVAVEVEGHGVLLNGRVYNNQYHFAMTMKDGLIVEVREYLDTQHVFETWFKE
jgi:ketosteroid isomerase-like protein